MIFCFVLFRLVQVRSSSLSENELLAWPRTFILNENGLCTALVIGSDDVAASYYVGMLSRAHGWQKGRKSGGSCGRQLLSWRAPISSIPKPAVTRFEMKSPDANSDDLVVRDRRNKEIAEDEVVR